MSLLAFATLLGCGASKPVSYRSKIDNEIVALTNRIARSDSNAQEVTQPVAHVLAYLKAEYPRKQWQALVGSPSDTLDNLETRLQAIYGKSLYRIVGGEMAFKDAYPFESYGSLDSFRVGFVKVVAPNMIPSCEREWILSQLQNYTQAIMDLLSADRDLKDRFEYRLKHMSGGAIELVLATNVHQAKFEELNMHYAIPKFGYYQSTTDSTVALYTARIATKYFGLISTSTILHELVHAVVGIIQRSPDRVVIPFRGLQSLRDTIRAMSDSSQDMMISEGVAESISQTFNPMYNSGHFNPVDANVLWQEKRYGKFHGFEAAGKCYNGYTCSFDGRILALYQAHSFVNHLVAEFGYPRVLRLAMCSSADANYVAILGKSKDVLFHEWETTLGELRRGSRTKHNWSLQL